MGNINVLYLAADIIYSCVCFNFFIFPSYMLHIVLAQSDISI